MQPFQGWDFFAMWTQGSSCVATLGCYGNCQVSDGFRSFSFLSLKAVFVFSVTFPLLWQLVLRCSSLLSARDSSRCQVMIQSQ